MVIGSVYLLRSETVRIIIVDKDANLSGNVQADLELPVGAPFDATLATAERFVGAAHAVNDQLGGTAIQSISTVVGNIASSRLGSRDERNASHLASVKTSTSWMLASVQGRNVHGRALAEDVANGVCVVEGERDDDRQHEDVDRPANLQG